MKFPEYQPATTATANTTGIYIPAPNTQVFDQIAAATQRASRGQPQLVNHAVVAVIVAFSKGVDGGNALAAKRVKSRQLCTGVGCDFHAEPIADGFFNIGKIAPA